MRTAPPNIAFTTTRWSLVLASAQPGDVRFRAALDELTRQYRDAIAAYIRSYYRCSVEDAEDITQAFVVRWIERGFANVVPDRGRFRSYLRGALRHFVQNGDVANRRSVVAARTRSRRAWAEPSSERCSIDHHDPEDAERIKWQSTGLDLRSSVGARPSSSRSETTAW